MSLNKAIREYVHYVNLVSTKHAWAKEALAYIPLSFLVSRQAEQVDKAYPKLMVFIRDQWGDKFVTQTLKEVSREYDRTLRMTQEDLLKLFIDDIHAYERLCEITPTMAEPAARDIGHDIRYIGSTLMTFKDMCAVFENKLHGKVRCVVSTKRDLFRGYYTGVEWFNKD
jgi:hypothetical protein